MVRVFFTAEEAPKMNRDGSLEFEVTTLTIVVTPDKFVEYAMNRETHGISTIHTIVERDKGNKE